MRNTQPPIDVKIEGRERKPIKVVLKDSDPIGRVILGKSLGRRKLLILAFDPLEPYDHRFIDIKNKPEILDASTETTRITETHKSAISQLDPLAVHALQFILQEFNNQREPSMKDVAEHLEITTRELGKLLHPLGIETQNTSRNWKHMRLYPRKRRQKIESLLSRSQLSE